MKIAFWSNLQEQVGVTTNVACLAAMSAISGMGKSILVENHYHLQNLGSILFSREQSMVLREDGNFYDKYGIEYVLKRMSMGEPGEHLIRKAAIPLLYSSMNYLPQSYLGNKIAFNYEFSLVFEELFQCLDRFCDYTFIDTETTGNASSAKILQEADLIVVTLNQDIHSWENLFGEYESILPKCVFLIGKYLPEYGLNMTLLRRIFRIPRNRIAAVPMNMELQEAMKEGCILQFLNKNNEKNDCYENRYLFRELKNAASMLRENIIHAQIQKREDRYYRPFKM